MIEPTNRKGGMALMQNKEHEDSHRMCQIHSILHLLSANKDLYKIAEENIMGKIEIDNTNIYKDFQKLFILPEDKRREIASTKTQYYAKDIIGDPIKPIVKSILINRYNASKGDIKKFLHKALREESDYGDLYIYTALTLYEILSPSLYDYREGDVEIFRCKFSNPVTYNLVNDYIMLIEHIYIGTKKHLFTKVALILEIDFEAVLFSYTKEGGGAHIFTLVRNNWGEEEKYILYNDYKGHEMYEYEDKRKLFVDFYRHIFEKKIKDMRLIFIFKKDRNTNYESLIEGNSRSRSDRIGDFINAIREYNLGPDNISELIPKLIDIYMQIVSSLEPEPPREVHLGLPEAIKNQILFREGHLYDFS